MLPQLFLFTRTAVCVNHVHFHSCDKCHSLTHTHTDTHQHTLDCVNTHLSRTHNTCGLNPIICHVWAGEYVLIYRLWSSCQEEKCSYSLMTCWVEMYFILPGQKMSENRIFLMFVTGYLARRCNAFCVSFWSQQNETCVFCMMWFILMFCLVVSWCVYHSPRWYHSISLSLRSYL